MTELDANDRSQAWMGYEPINWQRLARAQTWFAGKEYTYAEVPWAVPQKVVDVTAPPGAQAISVRGADAVLIGSAEQGFLRKVANSYMENLYRSVPLFAISPCFRGEPKIVPGHTQLTFMKLELFFWDTCPEDVEEASHFLIQDAEQFMTTEGAHLRRVQTPDGWDLYCDDVEVGSYGLRKDKNVCWAYATGVAEPRFSYALKRQQNRIAKWKSGR